MSKSNKLIPSINIISSLITIISFITISYQKPIIGLYGLVEPINDYQNYTKEAIDGAFVRWFESSGAEIVVIHIWYTEEEIIELLKQINGVVFSAGFRRPLKFDEFRSKLNQVIYVSATPGDYELELSGKPIEQIISHIEESKPVEGTKEEEKPKEKETNIEESKPVEEEKPSEEPKEEKKKKKRI